MEEDISVKDFIRKLEDRYRDSAEVDNSHMWGTPDPYISDRMRRRLPMIEKKWESCMTEDPRYAVFKWPTLEDYRNFIGTPLVNSILPNKMAAEQFKQVTVDNNHAAAAPPRTLLTWNIMGRKGSPLLNVRMPLIIDEIKKLDCDIVLLQEVTKDIYPTLVKDLSGVYNITPFPGQQLCQVTLSKHKIVDACMLLYNSNKSFVFCRTGGYGVWNVHLTSSRNADAQSIRAGQLQLMLAHAKDDKLVLAGDFNLSDKNQQLLFEDYKSLFADIHDIGTENTFNPTANPLAAAGDKSGIGRRFDKVWTRGFVLAAAAVACVDILVVDNQKLCLSDHYAIRAEFKE